ncbi:MAG: tetratricopeptide repeat protein [Caldilineaceae bacterium]
MSIEQQAIPTPKRIGAALRRGLLFTLLYGSLLGLGSMFIGTPDHNLWSLRYLWQRAGHPLVALLPADGDAVPADHRSGHLWQARASLAAGQFLQAEALLQPVLAQGDYDAQRLQAEILAARGHLAGAIQLWAQVGAVDDLLVAAQQAGRQGQVEVAMLAYRTAYGLAPERTVLPFAGFLRRERQDFAAAETLLRDYIAAMPSSRYLVSWLRELGTLYREQEAWDQAIAIYSQLVAAAPDSTADWVQLGWTYYERGAGAEEATTYFQQAITRTPQEGDGYYAIAGLFSREKRYAEADGWYAQALEREPEQQWWWLGRANAAQQAGNLTLALQLYATAQAKFPAAAQLHYQAAWAYKLAGDREKAVAAIEQALQLTNSDNTIQRQVLANYHARAGLIYEWTGQLQKAMIVYKQALQMDSQRQDVQKGLERLYGN